MGKETGISWTDHTFNPWIGCVRVSPGCEHCYAETLATNRMGLKVWGPAKTTQRRIASENYWRQPLKWNREAEQAGERRRVFCASMADVFEDHPAVGDARLRLFDLIEDTPFLDWLLLTKRPENIGRMLRLSWLTKSQPNIWLGTSVEDQRRADERIPHLLIVPAAVRFLSCEPLLGPVDLRAWLNWPDCTCAGEFAPCDVCDALGPRDDLNWVIVGGESGPRHRSMDLNWARSLRDQCAETGTAFFFKQDSGPRSGMNPTLDGETWYQWPESQRLVVA